ncbi:MAG TPA: glycosyltransferase family 4 protein [Ferruginibacter sp.]|mgnify:CR=1 FL=1|nr:glycosyltransferase family 4 protein [Ferruginibacter sp.]HMP20189.1 glycosyltransferase family 4 protein [Ferruginibacter sp.]
MTKVLLLNDQLTRGGKERRIAELVKYCKKHYNITFEIVIMHDVVEYEDIYETGFKVHVIDWSKSGFIQNFKKILAIAKAFKPDVIHSWSSMTDVLGVLLKFYLRKKLISSMIARVIPRRSLKDKDYRRALYTFPFTDYITSNTEAGIDRYHAPRKKSRCIYNGFNFERIQHLHRADELIHKHNLQDKYIVGMVAAFAERKDQESYIKAAQILLEQYPGRFAFLLIGYGPYQERCEKLAGTYFQQGIYFTGRCDYVEEYINIFNTGVLCTNSDAHGEGVSNSILEYMALGKPVIATDGEGTREIMIDAETGFIIAPKQPQVVADKILWLANNPAAANEMGQKGQQRIREHFSIESMCSSFINIYEQLTRQTIEPVSTEQKKQGISQLASI